jgi:exodeoxyribonuclease V beta subunit
MTVRVARPEVLSLVPVDRHAILSASAGTGKTYTLESLVVELLLSTDVGFDRILVVTFTERATNELRARIRAKLEALVRGAGDPPTAEQERGGHFWTIDDAARIKLERALYAFDAVTIATIHAFCQRVLRENAFASGRLFDEQQVDGRDAFARALREALRREVAGDPARAEWLEAALGAGQSPGRIDDLLWQCVQARGELRPPFDAGKLTAAIERFPRTATLLDATARELRNVKGVRAEAAERHLRTIATAVDSLRARKGIPARLVAADRMRRSGAMLYFRKNEDKLRAGIATTTLADAVGALDAACVPFVAAFAQVMLDPVRDVLARAKRERGLYDFDDMLSLVDEALRGPRGDALAAAMRGRWRFALIDEFQDTDETQWSIFRRAFFERGEPTSTLYLVGDPKQSIYRFRGADVHTYLRARDEVEAAGGACVPLEKNYRATRALVDATNTIFDPDGIDAVFTGEIGYAAVGCGRPERTLVDGAGREVTPVHVYRFAERVDLARLGAVIAREVRTITDPAKPWRFDGRDLAHGDVFVLTRTGREGQTLGAALREAGVPIAFFKQDGLFQTDEAREIHTLLSAIDAPHDRSRKLAAWLTPFFGLGLEALERLRDVSASHPLVARLNLWKAIADEGDFERLFESIVTTSGIVRREIFFADGERELTNYLHVFELLLEHAARTHATLRELVLVLSGLIERKRMPLDIEGNVQRLESDRRAVQIMTIHKAKGLEAPVVFVAGGFTGMRADGVRVYHDGGRRLAWVGAPIAAGVDTLVQDEERQEEERLMYVALTRAMGRMYLPCTVGKASQRGPYEVVNSRIRSIVGLGDPAFSVADVASERLRVVPPPRAPADWEPPPALVHPRSAVETRYAELRDARAGALVTSYTRMQGSRSARSPFAERGADERRAEKGADAVDAAPQATLRGARTSGIFLHEVLECVPLDSFGESPGFDAWRARADVAALFDEAMAVHRVDPSQREHAERLVWTAYATPVELAGGRRVAGFASTARAVREMDFVFPIPERDHPSLSTPRAGPLRVGRGYVRGQIDLAVEDAGLTYFVDWKSDTLAAYTPDALARHVEAHYEQQVSLYALAVVKLLGVRSREAYDERFGGLAYCFLRGFDANGQGLWSSRPSWEQVVAWEAALVGRRDWGAERGRSPRRRS